MIIEEDVQIYRTKSFLLILYSLIAVSMCIVAVYLLLYEYKEEYITGYSLIVLSVIPLTSIFYYKIILTNDTLYQRRLFARKSIKLSPSTQIIRNSSKAIAISDGNSTISISVEIANRDYLIKQIQMKITEKL